MKIKESYQKIRLDEPTQDHILESILESKEKDIQTKRNYKPLIVFAVIIGLIFIPITLPFSIMDSSKSYLEGGREIESASTPASQLYHLPSDLTLKSMKENQFYIQTIQENYNQNIMNDFLKSIEDKKEAHIIIVHFTIEGDPVLQDVHYTPKKTTIYRDATRDRFGTSTEIEKYEYRYIEQFKDTLYAYNNTLDLDQLENKDTFFITKTK